MIEKMKFLTITGPKNDIDRVVDEYLSKYDIQLENAFSELKNVQNISPYNELNPHKDSLAKINALADLVKEIPCKERKLTAEESLAVLEQVESELNEIQEKKDDIEAGLAAAQALLTDIGHFRSIP